MKKHKNIKAFLAGSSAFVFIAPVFVYYFFAASINPNTPYSVAVTPTALPILLGLLNVLFVYIEKSIPIKSINVKYLLLGGIYGALMASFGIFVADLPGKLFVIPDSYVPLIYIIAPVTYALVFRYVVKYLNNLLKISK